MESNINKSKKWIQSRSYHGLITDVANATGLSRETVRVQLLEGSNVTKSTQAILMAAIKLIKKPSQKLEKELNRGGSGDS
jgi:hypothetical protein